MRIKTFTITDFRSIEKATVPVSDLTCLVGANNEGKSNILRAVVLATSEILEQPMRRGRSSATNTFVPRRAAGQTRDFVDRYDLPRGKSNPKPSVEIAFELTERDSECFERELGHKINDDLKINVDFRKPYGDRVQVKKRRSGGALTLKSAEIAGFIRDRVRLEYIPAVRTAEQAVDVVRRLVADQLGALRRDSKYIDVQRQLDEIERPIIESIEHDLQMSMAEFLPDVKAVEIVRRDVMSGGRLGRYLDIDVNDGVQTDLEAKGDGVQSLAAIALARTASIRVDDEDHHLILAIEEPETHLHPAAIRRLRGVLREISRDQQVILTTHSPLLIDTEVPSTNIIVEDQKARPARQVAEVRDCLGVAISDNLTSARLVVFVEGSGDARAFEHLLSKHSKRLNDLIGEQAIRFEPLHGASKLSARASAMRATACSTYAVLDGDAEGRQAAERAVESGRIAMSDYFLLKLEGQRESVFEDLVKYEIYGDDLARLYDIHLTAGLGNGKGKKWSSKLSEILIKNGKLGNNTELVSAKNIVADTIVEHGLDSLKPAGRKVIEDLASKLESRFD